MKLLIIGGTSFVGRHLVEAALANGHDVTLFNRGKSNPGLFADLPRIIGDRRKDAGLLANQKWDAVIDSSAYSPKDLETVLNSLDTDHYTFISTISVYDDFSAGAVPEEGSKHQPYFESDVVTGETYGPLKVACEGVIAEREGLKSLIIRPAIIAGPHDPTDRFTYWAKRLSVPGEVLIPGGKNRKLQWIDARDLANFTLSMVEQGDTGVYNVAADPVTMEQFVDGVKSAEIHPQWIPDERLQEEQIKPFQIPFWIPVSGTHPEGFILAANDAAKKAGLKQRPMSETAEDTRQWLAEEDGRELKVGLSMDEERTLRSKLS